MATTMKAMVNRVYGSPDVIKLEQIPKPVPKDDEILIKVHASSVNPADWRVLRADPFVMRLMFGLFKPKLHVLGADVAGTVEAVGSKITKFKVGDAVFGDLNDYKWGAYAEFVVAREQDICLKPANLTFEQAGALGIACGTAFQAVEVLGEEIKPGSKVLITGASGGVGSYLVQIVKSYGAEVTAVCRTENVELVKSLGATTVIDYTKEDFLKSSSSKYDYVFECAATKSVSEVRTVMTPTAQYVFVGGDTLMEFMIRGTWLSWTSSNKYKNFFAKPTSAKLQKMKEFAEAGRLVPAIEKVYTLEEVPDAIRKVESKHTRGKHVIKVAD